VIGVMVGIGFDVQGIVVAEDILLDAFVHIARHVEEVLRIVFMLVHLLNSSSIAHQSLLVTQVALNHLLLLGCLLS
jgi:hypothetical protein